MNANDALNQNRRRFLQAVGAIALAGLSATARAAGEATGKVKIGIIGSGKIGGTLGGLWVKAGHEVMFSSLDLEHDKALAASLGPNARAGTTREAAAFGEVLLMAVPYGALPQLGRDLAGPQEVSALLAPFRGNRMAWALVEMAVWDLWDKSLGQPLDRKSTRLNSSH